MRQLTGLFLFLGFGAAVEAQEIRGPYVGAAFGSFSYEESGENLGLPLSDASVGYRLIGGYQFNSAYAIEVGWGVSGEIKERFQGFDPNVGNVSLDIEGEYEIATVRFLAVAPFSSMNVYGGAGYYDATLEARYRFESPDEVLTQTEEGGDDGLTVVGGVQYDFRRFALRGEYEWFDTDNGVDAQSLNVAVIFRF